MAQSLGAERLRCADDHLPASLVCDLRTDHAGETGAVMIYRGMLAASRDAAVRRFAHAHLATETGHLTEIESFLAPRQRSRLLPLWRIAGWLTGALPALWGSRAVYATVEAVETFVDRHYGKQIDAIGRLDPARARSSLQAVRSVLISCQADEVGHRDEAAMMLARSARPASRALQLWVWAIGAGSRLAVKTSSKV